MNAGGVAVAVGAFGTIVRCSLRCARQSVMDGAHPYWSWAHVPMFTYFDIQTERMTRLEQVHSNTGGHTMSVNDTGIYDRYLTSTALMRLGDA
jgi:hypothetical protein